MQLALLTILVLAAVAGLAVWKFGPGKRLGSRIPVDIPVLAEKVTSLEQSRVRGERNFDDLSKQVFMHSTEIFAQKGIIDSLQESQKAIIGKLDQLLTVTYTLKGVVAKDI